MALVGIVVPAHDEEQSIRRLLEAISSLEEDAEVVVVCNGCTDRTAAVVREVAPWVLVVEIAEAWKPAALRAGDDAVATTPRLYLDADVVVSGAGIRRLVDQLGTDGLLAVAPTPRYDVAGSSLLLRSHFRIWIALQSRSNAISGTGAMLVSAAGRQRFGIWPDVIADDYFLDGHFAPEEKRRVADVEVVVVLPRRFSACISRRARVRQGNRDVDRAGLRPTGGSAGGAGGQLVDLVRNQPTMLVHVPGHLAVTVATRVLGVWRRWRGGAPTFYRDVSTR